MRLRYRGIKCQNHNTQAWTEKVYRNHEETKLRLAKRDKDINELKKELGKTQKDTP